MRQRSGERPGAPHLAEVQKEHKDVPQMMTVGDIRQVCMVPPQKLRENEGVAPPMKAHM